ncbi:hypothetical protein [Streptobacillus moniliformis]|uniref:hypothetical protein n=1 Tax=Streptobacillus moniliformis TaxID=34105 RepID=UPI0007E45F90|nr:hypothetical protein [Streptobacillus moniliformis]
MLGYKNVNGRYTNEINVDAKYGLDAIFHQGSGNTKNINEKGTYQALSIDFGGKSRYKARENVEVILSLDNEYNLNGLNKEVYGVYVDYIKDSTGYKESIHKYAEKYDVSKQDSLRKEKGKIKDLTKGKLSSKAELEKAIHSLTVKPKISTEFSYVEGRLKVSPWIGAEFNLENKPNGAANNGTTENKDFVKKRGCLAPCPIIL